MLLVRGTSSQLYVADPFPASGGLRHRQVGGAVGVAADQSQTPSPHQGD